MTQQRVSPVVITSQLPATVTQTIRGALGQSADLMQILDSAGFVLAKVTSNGTINAAAVAIGSGGSLSTDNVVDRAFSGPFLVMSSTVATMQTRAATNIGLTVNGVTGQTANLMTFNVNGVAGGARVPAAGNYFIAPGISSTFALDATAGTASTVPITVNGAAGQSTNLQIWRSSAGTVLARIGSDGNIETVAGLIANGNYTNSFGGGVLSNTILAIRPGASNIGLAVRGAASQTANLTEWQDSGANILARVRNDGVVVGSELRTNSNNTMIREENSGGVITQLKSTAAAANPGSGQAKIYFRDGTVPGTLKLVVRAGAAGAETTILDNIPQ
jgi:hypothetical protein